MVDNQEEITYVFNNIDMSCLAAIEYVSYKYGNEEWFNAALTKVVTDTYSNSKSNVCNLPFIFKKINEKDNDKVLSLKYKGHHSIIDRIEKYNDKYSNNNNNYIGITIIFFILYNLLLILLIVISNPLDSKNPFLSNLESL